MKESMQEQFEVIISQSQTCKREIKKVLDMLVKDVAIVDADVENGIPSLSDKLERGITTDPSGIRKSNDSKSMS
jgi:hypothetical protein